MSVNEKTSIAWFKYFRLSIAFILLAILIVLDRVFMIDKAHMDVVARYNNVMSFIDFIELYVINPVWLFWFPSLLVLIRLIFIKRSSFLITMLLEVPTIIFCSWVLFVDINKLLAGDRYPWDWDQMFYPLIIIPVCAIFYSSVLAVVCYIIRSLYRVILRIF